jgi:hypothetical protein
MWASPLAGADWARASALTHKLEFEDTPTLTAHIEPWNPRVVGLGSSLSAGGFALARWCPAR